MPTSNFSLSHTHNFVIIYQVLYLSSKNKLGSMSLHQYKKNIRHTDWRCSLRISSPSSSIKSLTGWILCTCCAFPALDNPFEGIIFGYSSFISLHITLSNLIPAKTFLLVSLTLSKRFPIFSRWRDVSQFVHLMDTIYCTRIPTRIHIYICLRAHFSCSCYKNT